MKTAGCNLPIKSNTMASLVHGNEKTLVLQMTPSMNIPQNITKRLQKYLRINRMSIRKNLFNGKGCHRCFIYDHHCTVERTAILKQAVRVARCNDNAPFRRALPIINYCTARALHCFHLRGKTALI